MALAQTDSTNLVYPLEDSHDPTQNNGGIIDFEDPLNLNSDIQYDPVTGKYIFTSKLGENIDYRPSSSMTMEEYLQYINNRSMQQYWQDQVDAQVEEARKDKAGDDSSKPKIDPSKGVRKIFGSDFIEIRPQGSAELSFGLNISKTENPIIPVKQRRITTFDFDQQIQMNLTGKIGDLMQIGFNYNTEATFDFDNKLKLDYSGEEDDIIQKIEAGNVSLPLNSSLITGSQSLFGIKTELKFGRLTTTTVLSQQKGQRKEIEVAGGAQVNEFELFADNYEENRHYFLNYHFHDTYDSSLATLPVVTSGIQIQRIEVWITNKTNDYDETRNVIAFTDLGESKLSNLENPAWFNSSPEIPENGHNTLYASVASNAGIRNYATASNILSGPGYNMQQSVEYEKLQNARLLSKNEYTYNSLLGFISLNQSLNNDEVLAVAYQYTYKGNTYQVGEFSTDGIAGQDALFLKLLKSTVRNPKKKLWDLMMKNVYSLGAYQVDAENFRLEVVYTNPSNGVDINYIPRPQVQTKLLIQLLDLDRLDQQLRPHSDGVFDFVPVIASNGVINNAGTINPRNGRVYFTTIEPFGKTLDKKLQDAGVSQAVRNSIVFNPLYDSTVTAARQIPELNRFKIKGSYQSSVSSEISLNALNIPQGSVKVTAGGRVLQEGTHYTVDYNLGRVKILDDGILSSGTPIKISLESNSLFSIQTKSLIGTHFDYRISRNANIGATVLRLTEKPLTQKVNIGDEPISNTMLGLDGGFKREVPLLTKLVDMIPLINTKEKSTVSFSGEVAALIPGHNRAIGKEGNSYIDAFEGSQSAIDIRSYNSWVIASVPQGQPDLFPEASEYNNLLYGKNRARLAWHVIDPLFLNNNNQTPDYIKDSEFQKDNRTRQVLVTEVFPNQQLGTGQLTNIPVLDLNYYPSERGPYNYDAVPTPFTSGADPNTGGLANPASRWGGIMRPLTTNDFEAANVEFIQFWVMDPFHNSVSNSEGEPASNEDSPNTTGGDLYFNLGNVSEDILRDGQKAFENGLPADGVYDPQTLTTTAWGWVPTTQVIVNAFDNDPNSRVNQDVGYDGLRDDKEATFFTDFLNDISTVVTNPAAIQALQEDPSSDDYNYFLDDDYDAQQVDILTRYKKYNNPEGNSPSSETSATLNQAGYPTSATTLPNVEDINRDNNLNETESYFQYKVSMRPQDMVVGKNFITDRILATDNNSGKQVYWYQFRIPINEYDKKVNGIQDFRAIRFMRIFMQGWSQEAVLRFARLDLIRGQWRTYNGSLLSAGEYIQGEESNTSFVINAVNIEQNGSREPIHYVLPNGIQRQVNYQTANLAQLNEQSLVLDVCGLQDGDARAGYKNVKFDVRNYNKIQMFVHGEANDINDDVQDGDVTVFVRLGTDFVNNYYEYEMPLKLSTWNNHTPESVWPEENNMVIDLTAIREVKKQRNASNYSTFNRYTVKDPNDETRNITVIGNPNLQNLKTIMIGVRNPKKNDPTNLGTNDDGLEKCVEVWVNELRLTDFNQHGGWATIGRVNAQLADFADVSLSGNYSTPYFGSIEQKVGERQQEYVYGMDASSTVQLGKFFGKKAGVQLPMYVGYSNNTIKPLYDPLNPDLSFEKNPEETDEEWKERFRKGANITERRSLNFTNVRIDPSAGKKNTGSKKIKKPHFYDVKNVSVSYSYSEITHVDINTQLDRKVNYLGSLTYGFSNSPKPWEPFKRTKAFRKSKWLRPVKDFNLYFAPKKIGFRTTMNRTYNEFENRSNIPGGLTIPNYTKTFNWDRDYDFKYDLTKSLKFDFTAKNRAFINDPYGKVDYGAFGYERESARDSVDNSLRSFGETMNYGHTMNVSYKWPLKKFPITDWMSLNTRYTANFDWKRAPLALPSVGNVVQNSRSVQWNSKLNMTSLYNKVPYFKKINQTRNRRRPTSRKNMNNKKPEEGKKDDDDKKGKKKKDSGEGFDILKESAKILMSLKNVSGTYTTNDGILLPGFAKQTEMLGLDQNFSGQSWEFVAGGFQEYDMFGERTGYNYAQTAYQNGWLVDTTEFTKINTQYAITHTEKLNLKATLKPIKGFRIDLTANYNIASNKTANLGTLNNNFELLNNKFTGSYSRSIITWKTAFVKDKGGADDLTNITFDKLREIRTDVSQLLGANNPNSTNVQAEGGYAGGYNGAQQDVIIGAFLTAYTGQAVNEKNINPFRKMPLPNWRISYDGLSKIKWVKKYVKTLSFSHAYRSSFNLANYTTNLGYNENDFGATELDMAGNFISQKQIMNVSISEQFQPLLGVNMTLNNGVKAKLEMKKDRNIGLSISNNQITEIKGSEIVIGSGYVFKKLQLPIKFDGKPIKPSDLNLDLSVSIRDNKTITRKIIENQNKATAGQQMISIKFTAKYSLTKSLMVRAFYDRVVNNPVISTSFPTANTKAGFALRFMLQ